MGYEPARKYHFSHYIHGPYSSSLANQYFENGENKLENAVPDPSISTDTIKIIREADSKGVNFLEALTTLLSLRDQFYSARLALSKAETLKPYMDEKLWIEAEQFIKRYPTLWKNE